MFLQLPPLQVEHVMSDFEAAVMQQLPGNYEHNGCYFHYSQCLYRTVQRLGFQVEYHDNENFRIAVKCLIALAVVPLNLNQRPPPP